MTKPDHIVLCGILNAYYTFAHDTRSKTTQYAIDRRTHVARPFTATTGDTLYRDLMRKAWNTIDPGTNDMYQPPTRDNMLVALLWASSEADQHTIVPAKRSMLTGDDLWVDLGRDDGTALRINAQGIGTANLPDEVAWLRDETAAGMNEPVAGTDFHDAVRRFMEIIRQDYGTAVLLTALLVHNLTHPNGPGSQQPLLLLTGASGAGKTTTSMMYQDLVDPKQDRTENSGGRIDPESLCMNASRNGVVVLGNSSRIPSDVWDLICTIVTGGSVSARKLYSQTDIVRWFINCQLVITGVTIGRLPEDIVTRMVHIELEPHADGGVTEQALWREWDNSRDMMRTGLWQLCSRVMRMERDGTIPLEHLDGRLRDFETTLRAVDLILGTNAEREWLESLDSEQALQQSDDPIVMALIHQWDNVKDLTLTSSQLYAKLKPVFDTIGKGDAGTKRQAPGSARALGQGLNRTLPALEALNIKVTTGWDAHAKIKTWLFKEGDGFTPPDDPIQPASSAGPFNGLAD